LLATLSGHQGSVINASFSPDGRQILTASSDKTAKVWDIKGNLLATLSGHQGSVNNASFSPDGRQILTASSDNTAKVWDGVDTNLDRLIERGCEMMRDYLTTNPHAKEEDRQMCGIGKH
jgi:WD40 repeat protein